MTPEIRVFVLATALVAFVYVAVYPRLSTKTLNRMMLWDLALTVVLLLVVGGVYYGTGIAFSLVLFTAPWWVFTLLSAALVEVPFFIWFCKRWNIDLKQPM
jgi:hypothetical protein